IALEDRVLAHRDLDVEVARRSAGHAGLALAGQADAVAVVDAGRDLHLQHFLLADATVAGAVAAGAGDHLATAAAGRTGLLHGEDAALHAHLATAAAGLAAVQVAVGRAGTGAGAAGRQGRHLDALLDAEHRFLQVQLDHVTQVGAAARTATRAATAEDVAKDVTEDVVDVGESGTRAGPAPAHAVLEGGMAVLVVEAPLAAVGQHLVGLLGLLEARFRLGVARIAGGVVFLRGAPVVLLDLLFGGIAGHAQHLLVIALAHRVFPGSFTPLPAPSGKSLPPGRGQSPPHAVACGQATY